MHAKESGPLRLFRYLLLLLMIALVGALPGQAHAFAQPGEGAHQAHLLGAHDADAFFGETTAKSAHAATVHFGAIDPDCHGAAHHNDNCCCMSCAPSFTLPHIIALQVRFDSQRSALSIPRANLWPAGATPELSFRPPIRG